jgi:hypothetical protein
MKPFTPDELQEHKENLAVLSVKIEEIEDERKARARHYKAMLDPLVKNRSQLVRNVRQKSGYVDEPCYKFVDRETRETGYYNADGDLIELRPATADELQPNLFYGVQKTGTNN